MPPLPLVAESHPGSPWRLEGRPSRKQAGSPRSDFHVGGPVNGSDASTGPFSFLGDTNAPRPHPVNLLPRSPLLMTSWSMGRLRNRTSPCSGWRVPPTCHPPRSGNSSVGAVMQRHARLVPTSTPRTSISMPWSHRPVPLPIASGSYSTREWMRTKRMPTGGHRSTGRSTIAVGFPRMRVSFAPPAAGRERIPPRSLISPDVDRIDQPAPFGRRSARNDRPTPRWLVYDPGRADPQARG